jgi:gibberellin 3-beta-dioxygenase
MAYTRSTSDECSKELTKLAYHLLPLMVNYFGIPEESLEDLLGPDFHSKQVTARLRINHYSVCTEPEKTWGLHSHTDSDIFTILHQDSVRGLQVRFKDGSWHGVCPIDGALVVNVGNFLQVISFNFDGFHASALISLRVAQIIMGEVWCMK